jgi:putative membrane protein
MDDDHRRPTWVYGVGEEPDHRFSLANERTFLAWIRTSLGLIGSGAAVEAFGIASPGVRTTLAGFLILVGGVCGAGSSLRWARVERALRRRRPMPATGLTWLASAAVLGVAIVILLVIW